MPALTDGRAEDAGCRGWDRWWMVRSLTERGLGTTPIGDSTRAEVAGTTVSRPSARRAVISRRR